ncbi:hypothetical protein J6590_019796 [Homalodisca vitripennis]|nr:hypothetical protein J6590_019796 [Homalodisca vitripennis]
MVGYPIRSLGVGVEEEVIRILTGADPTIKSAKWLTGGSGTIEDPNCSLGPRPVRGEATSCRVSDPCVMRLAHFMAACKSSPTSTLLSALFWSFRHRHLTLCASRKIKLTHQIGLPDSALHPGLDLSDCWTNRVEEQ